jgi:hypothetical protein
MNIDKRTFKFAGSSADPNGVYKARFANDLEARPKVMTKCGHTNFVLVELPKPMTKSEALVWLMETKPVGVNQECLSAKAVYISKQIAKLSGTGTGAKRGRPSTKNTVAKSAETLVSVNPNVLETPAAGSVVSTILSTVRSNKSVRAKAVATATKVTAAKK